MAPKLMLDGKPLNKIIKNTLKLNDDSKFAVNFNPREEIPRDELPAKVRNWCFTLHDYTDKDIARIKTITGVSYMIIGDETCPTTGRKHLQGFISFIHQRSTSLSNFKKLKKLISERAYIAVCKGNPEQNFIYCSKEKILYEYGERPKGQGCRTDLNSIRDDIVSGRSSVDEIVLSNPYAYHQYGRTLHRIEDVILRNSFRNWMTTCDWFFGDTGTGKSREAFKNFSPITHYVYKNDNGWWDGYTGQSTVIIDEFRGQIPYNELLSLIDINAYGVKRRSREPAPFLARHIIITSPMTPDEVYHNLSANDRLTQLHRRIKLYHFTKDGKTEVSPDFRPNVVELVNNPTLNIVGSYDN